ncbi:MAG TPA: hypothetical protein VJT67_16570 [Longimicrobiaceae bacterium]|nr:hypothetical protein [Longimicrobiaceae bacterium]
MTGIPGRRRQKFYEKKTVVELLAVVPPVAMGAVTAVINLRDPERRTLGWLLIAAIVWLAMASVVKVLHARAQDREQKHREEYDGLLGALHVLYSLVSTRAGLDGKDNGRLRGTIHRVVPSGEKGKTSEELEQLLPYLGGSGGEAGRRFSIRSGVLGKAVREKSAFAASRQSQDYDAFVAELVRDWAFTEDDARRLSSDRRAWMAVPIFGAKGTVVAAAFLDSNETGFFTPELQQLIIDACSGVASYTKEVYR